MKIEKISDIGKIFDCIPFEQDIRNKGRDKTKISNTILFIKSQLNNPYFGFWIAYNENGGVIGYTIALATKLPGFDRLILLRMYAKNKEIRKELEKVLIEFADSFKIKMACITVPDSRYSKILQRHSDWKEVSINLERKVK